MIEKPDVAPPPPVDGSVSGAASEAGSRRAGLARALREATYEMLPFGNTEEKVLAHVPPDVALTVTTTEVKGLDLRSPKSIPAHGERHVRPGRARCPGGGDAQAVVLAGDDRGGAGRVAEAR
ncbi:hypothetical protein [Streptomyces shenzhenensis]|uniref:hypothetical protein n=1 Tax=Streptomyces shenzhenensis TaxID=943815 RepID=UPI0015F08CE6|nr:hypothetical protein [Streptomyces shenzhenensis]